MKKKLLDLLVFLVLAFILFGITAVISRVLVLVHLKSVADSFVFSTLIRLFRVGIILFFLVGITYKWLWSREKLQNTSGKVIFSSLLFFLFLFITSLYYLLVDFAPQYYSAVKQFYNTETFIEGEPYQADAQLGFSFKPSNRVYRVSKKTGEKDTILRTDENSCRVAFDFKPSDYSRRPLVMFLGCSFTYGHGIDNPENTFAHKSSTALGGYPVNFAVAGYGLSQMLMRTQTMVPRLKPDVVVVQYSPWLVDRATAYYIPNEPLKLTTSYFTADNGSISFCKPAFETRQYSSTMLKYRLTPASTTNYIAFLFEVAAPAFYHDVFARIGLTIKEWLHLTPKPAKDKKAVEKYVYDQIYETCRQNGAKMAVLNLGNPVYTKDSHRLLSDKGDVIFVEADSVLWSRVSDSLSYDRAYCFWRSNGTDSVVSDRHPSYNAHSVIAETVVAALKPMLTPADSLNSK